VYRTRGQRASPRRGHHPERPLQKIHVIEPYVSHVGFVHTMSGDRAMVRNLSIDEHREE
jgi:uncharacterized protein YPO0396